MNSVKAVKVVVSRDSVRCKELTGQGALHAGVYPATVEIRYIPIIGGLRSECVKASIKIGPELEIDILAEVTSGKVRIR